jgi:putative phosphoribosyl transferase
MMQKFAAYEVRERELELPVGEVGGIAGTLRLPAAPQGVVLFAHGSGSSRHSPRNRFVAQVLNEAALATVLFDLLTPREAAVDDETAQFRFDIDLLAARLATATQQIRSSAEVASLPLGYFGASTGAAAALVAAARLPREVAAVVSRGGRPDLAGERLRDVRAPTLFIVGSADPVVLALNRQAMAAMQVQTQLAIVPGATHLFEEPEALEQVARLARDWFVLRLPAPSVHKGGGS